MNAEEPSKLGNAWNFIKAAYYGRHGFYKRMGVFLERVEAPESATELLKDDEKHSNVARILCCCMDLAFVSSAAIATPYFLAGLALTVVPRYLIARETNRNIKSWEGYKGGIFDKFYILANIKDLNKKSKKNPKPDTNIYQQELGLDSIDDILEEYREWEEPEQE